MKKHTLTLLAVTLFMFAGCASSKKAAEHPLSGMWDYSVDTPEGVYEGTINVAENEGELMGFITSEALSGQMDLSNINFMDNTLSFSFDSGQYGMINLKVTVDGDAFNGFLAISGIGEMPVTGSKKVGDM